MILRESEKLLFEALKQKGAPVIVRSSAADTMNLGGLRGPVALASTTQTPGARAEQVEVNLNELGQPGWEVVATEWPHNGRRLMVIAKRSPAAQRAGQRQARRRRDWPGTSTATRPQDL